MNTKSEIRLWAKQIRHSLDMTLVSRGIVEKIRSMDTYQKSDNIMMFYPLDNEVNLLSLLDDDKSFYLPRVRGKYLDVCKYNKGDILKKSGLKIYEPVSETVNPDVLDIVFIPALTVDTNFNRLGYGGGYYDRFLVSISAKKYVVIPDELVIDVLPTDEFDIKCDGFITQKKASY